MGCLPAGFLFSLSERFLNFDPPSFRQIFWRVCKIMVMRDPLSFNDFTRTYRHNLNYFFRENEKDAELPYNSLNVLFWNQLFGFYMSLFGLCSVCWCVISSIKRIFHWQDALAAYIFKHLDKKSVIHLSCFKKFKSSAHRNLDPPSLSSKSGQGWGSKVRNRSDIYLGEIFTWLIFIV